MKYNVCGDLGLMKGMATVPPCEADSLCIWRHYAWRFAAAPQFFFSFTHRAADLCRLALCCQHTLVTLAMLKRIK